MGLFDKFMDVMRLSPDDDDDDYFDDEYYDEEEEAEPVRKKPSRKEKNMDVVQEEKPRPVSKITPMRPSKRQSSGTSMAVCVIKPTSFEDAREITETLLANRTVVLNVEGLDVEIAQRIIDFSSGSCFAINGNLQKISNYIFILTPEAVDISGDFQNILDAFDTSGIQTDFR